MIVHKTVCKGIPVTVRIPEHVNETLKQEKINYIYDLLTAERKLAQVKEQKN